MPRRHRRQGEAAADHFLGVILPGLPIAAAENSLEEVIEAARIKASTPLSFADCFAATTAMREDASLVTGDPAFKKLGKIVALDWIG